MKDNYGFTVLTKEEIESIGKPDYSPNFTVTWSDDDSKGFVSGLYGALGKQFNSANEIRSYIYSNGWSKPDEVTL